MFVAVWSGGCPARSGCQSKLNLCCSVVRLRAATRFLDQIIFKRPLLGLKHCLCTECFQIPQQIHITLSCCRCLSGHVFRDGFWGPSSSGESSSSVELLVPTTWISGAACSKESMFKSFSSHLYEARWGAVMDFLKFLTPLLPVLAASYDGSRFKSGVDFTGCP